MAADSKQLNPALQYLKDNAVVIGLIVIVAASIAFFVFTQSASAAKPVAAVTPAAVPTAALDGNTPATAATSASAPPAGPSGSTASSTAAAGAQGPAQPSPSPTPTKVVLGKEPQAVSAKDWRPYAQDFSKAWANTADGKDAWLSRLKPLVSADLYAGFTRTDVSTLPAATYESVSLAEESKASKTFRAYSTKGQMFEGRVSIQADGSWLVDQVGPPTK
jgi:hypothetical protein